MFRDALYMENIYILLRDMANGFLIVSWHDIQAGINAKDCCWLNKLNHFLLACREDLKCAQYFSLNAEQSGFNYGPA